MRRSLRLPAAIVTALVAAEAAVLLLRPRDPGPDPVPVDARAYFSERVLEKGEAFRSGQRWLMIAALVVEGAVLAWLVWRPPAALRERFGGFAARRPVLSSAAAAAAVAVTLTVATLPISAASRERGLDVGLVTRSWWGWVGDVALSTAIGAAIAAAGGAVLVAAMRRFGRRWWIAGAVAVFGFGVISTYAAPVVLDPLFNRFTELPPQSRVRAAVLDLADEANVDVGEVFVIDASKRTSGANAYVAGLFGTKRVVLYDTLLDDFSFDEVRLVVAHELAHVRYDDVPNGLLYLAIVAPFGVFAVARLAEALGVRPERAGPRAVPAVALALAFMVPAITAISNQLSRAVEARADAFAMRATGDPRAQVAFQRRIAVANVSDVDPPGWYHWLFGTHPTTLDRIGAAERLLREDS